MKAWILMPLALLLGLVLGGWGPRTELRTMREELETARKAARSGAVRRETSITGITDMLGIEGGRSGSTSARRETATAAGGEAGETGRNEGSGPEGSDADTPGDDAEDSVSGVDEAPVKEPREASVEVESTDSGLGSEIERAAELWEARADIARATFAANVGLSQGEIDRFDALTVAMNMRVEQAITRFAEDAEQASEVRPEDGIRLGSEVLGAMVLTYDAMDESLPTDWRRRAGAEFSLTDFVDPTVATPLIGVEDKLEDAKFN